jgi:hypothetical protein
MPSAIQKKPSALCPARFRRRGRLSAPKGSYRRKLAQVLTL